MAFLAAKSGDAAPVGVDRVDRTVAETIPWITASLSGSFGGTELDKPINPCKCMMSDCQIKGYMLV